MAPASAGGQSGTLRSPAGGENLTLSEHFVARRDPHSAGLWQVLAGGERTAGSVSFGEARLHVHTREDEAAYVSVKDSLALTW